ncbi:MAG: hypothetical protein SPL79_07260 [Sphaerochaetaceae bacterium]|nr:hypothetical protein [Sphaerochaetaceae bacterium]
MGSDAFAYNFWKNVDLCLKAQNKRLTDLALSAEVNYKSLKNSRSLNRFPTTETTYALAIALNTTVEHLMSGKTMPAYPPRIKSIADHLCTISDHDLDTVETMVMALPASQTKYSTSMEA